MVPFTKKQKVVLKAPSLIYNKLSLAQEDKYLDINIDRRLTWNSHIKNQANLADFYFNQKTNANCVVV